AVEQEDLPKIEVEVGRTAGPDTGERVQLGGPQIAGLGIAERLAARGGARSCDRSEWRYEQCVGLVPERFDGHRSHRDPGRAGVGFLVTDVMRSESEHHRSADEPVQPGHCPY